jgi:hypothetical protein
MRAKWLSDRFVIFESVGPFAFIAGQAGSGFVGVDAVSAAGLLPSFYDDWSMTPERVRKAREQASIQAFHHLFVWFGLIQFITASCTTQFSLRST